MKSSNIFLLSLAIFIRFCRTESNQTVSIMNPSFDQDEDNLYTDDKGNQQKWNGIIIEEVNDEGETINPENSNRSSNTNSGQDIPVQTEFKSNKEKNDFFDQCLNTRIDNDTREYNKDLMKSFIYSFRVLCEMTDDQIRNIGIGQHQNWFGGKVLVKSFIRRDQVDTLQAMFDKHTRFFKTKAHIRNWINGMIASNITMFTEEYDTNNDYKVWEDFFKITEINKDVINEVMKSKEGDIPAGVRNKLVNKNIKTSENGKYISPLERNFVGFIGFLLKD